MMDRRVVDMPKLVILATLVCVFTLCLPLVAGCGGLQLKSHWLDREVTVDGMDHPESEWQGARTYLEDEDVAVGLLNDDEYLYISLVTSDRMKLRQVLGAGLTLWLNPAGGKDKTFGIRFPLGRAGEGPKVRGQGERGSPEEMERNIETALEAMKELEILGPGKDGAQRMDVAEARGIEVKAGFSNGFLVYELKVPIVATAERPYAIGAERAESVVIDFETPEVNMDQMREHMGGRGGGMGGRGGGMGPPGGSMGGRGRAPGGGGMGGERPGRPEPLDFKIVAELASQNGSSEGDEK
jgi:hypothetical protein